MDIPEEFFKSTRVFGERRTPHHEKKENKPEEVPTKMVITSEMEGVRLVELHFEFKAPG